MLTPQMELPALSRKRRAPESASTVACGGRIAVDPLIAGLDQYQQTAFDMLRSPKLREALDLSKERRQDDRTLQAASPRQVPLSRRAIRCTSCWRGGLIEAGVPIVHFSLGYWDWHGENFVAGRQQIPMFDSGLSALLEDLDERGLLDIDDRARPRRNGSQAQVRHRQEGAGRDHWDYAQFVLAAGGGFKRGCIVGATDKLGEQVTDNFYKVESFGRRCITCSASTPKRR